MRDFVLAPGFLQSCIDLPEETRGKMLSKLRALTADPRNRELGVSRAEESKHILWLPIDAAYRILLRRERSDITLIRVTGTDSASTPVIPKRAASPEHLFVAPVDALELLLAEEKYLPLAKHLMKIPSSIREVSLQFFEIEEIVNIHLPPEARRYHNWWANQKTGKRAHSFAWMAAGWLVSNVDIKADVVKFIRQDQEAGRPR